MGADQCRKGTAWGACSLPLGHSGKHRDEQRDPPPSDRSQVVEPRGTTAKLVAIAAFLPEEHESREWLKELARQLEQVEEEREALGWIERATAAAPRGLNSWAVRKIHRKAVAALHP